MGNELSAEQGQPPPAEGAAAPPQAPHHLLSRANTALTVVFSPSQHRGLKREQPGPEHAPAGGYGGGQQPKRLQLHTPIPPPPPPVTGDTAQ